MEEVLFQEVYIFITGGEDTSASLITSALYFLYQHPDTLKQVYVEIDQHI